MGGKWCVSDDSLVPVQHIAAARFGRGGFQIGPIIAALWFGIGKGDDHLSGDDAANHIVAPAAVFQGTAADHHGGQIGFKHQLAAELLHHNHIVDHAAAKAALTFRKGCAEDAEFFGKGLPRIRRPAVLAADLHAGVMVVAVQQVTLQRVAQHGLGVVEAEVHFISFPSPLEGEGWREAPG